MNRRRIALTAFVLAAAAAVGAEASLAAGITPVPIPPGYGFPTAKPVINEWIRYNDVGSMRNHAWQLWAGMGSPSQGWPVWETWYNSSDVFTSCAPQGKNMKLFMAAFKRTSLHNFVVPRQFLKADKNFLQRFKANGGQGVVSGNKFDPTAVTFLKTPHPGPGGANYCYVSKASLTALNNAWPAGTSTQDRGIVDFPDQAIETKPVYSLVKKTGLTPQPLWQGIAGSTNHQYPTPDTWTTCVLVDPAGSGGLRKATAAEIASAHPATGLACNSSKYLYAPLSMMYSFAMSAAEATAYNNALNGGTAAAGDYAVLVAMHVNTKEIADWTWQTYYWAPGGAGPYQVTSPGSIANQPASLPAPWKDYAMCTNYNQNYPFGTASMDVCYNPYLETNLTGIDGTGSNCMSCHGAAVVGPGAGYPPTYTKAIAFFTDPTYFTTHNTHTDFSWAVPDESQ
jgi:hypothetical protein